ncbi:MULTISPECIES: hypothetical protein [unclassified Exiguobacterium]|nr:MULTISPECIES: hypothetical protein [unclassified Exiguobacterium]
MSKIIFNEHQISQLELNPKMQALIEHVRLRKRSGMYKDESDGN